MDTFQHEQDPTRKNGWRVVRIGTDGTRHPLPQRFNKALTAAEHAYKLQVRHERRHNRTVSVHD